MSNISGEAEKVMDDLRRQAEMDKETGIIDEGAVAGEVVQAEVENVVGRLVGVVDDVAVGGISEEKEGDDQGGMDGSEKVSEAAVEAEVGSITTGGFDEERNEEEVDERRRSEGVLERGESERRGESTESDSYGATSSSRSFIFAVPVECVEKKVRRSSCHCEPSTSTAPPQCHDEEEEEGSDGQREESLMSSRYFDDTEDDWMKLPPRPANEELRKVMRRQSLCHNLPHMTEAEAYKFFKPSDFFDMPDMYSTDSSSTTNESEESYWRGLEAHRARQARKMEFMALSKEAKRLVCAGRRKRIVMKRGYSLVYHLPYEDMDYLRKPQKRRRVGEEESAEDDWDVEDRLMRKRTATWRKYRGVEYEGVEPAIKRLNQFVEFIVMPAEEEADGEIVEGRDLEGVEAPIGLAADGVEQGVAEVGAVDDNPVEMADAAAEESDEMDDEEPMDRSIGSDDDMSSVSSTATAIPLRRSQRVRKPVDRWSYPVDHIPRRRRYVRRDATVQMARPIRRRPMMLPRPAAAPVVKQPRQLPLASRGAPALPAPAPATSIAASHKVVLFADIGEELEECRKTASAADFGADGLELAIKISRIASSCDNFRKKNAVPSPVQMKRILTALGKVRSMLGMN